MRADAVLGVVVFQEQTEPEQIRVLLDKLRDLHLDLVAQDGRFLRIFKRVKNINSLLASFP
jgi:hypothetical protein